MYISVFMTTDELVRQVLLPQIIQLQIEVAALRKHTWPYVQAQKEHNQLDVIEAFDKVLLSLDVV